MNPRTPSVSARRRTPGRACRVSIRIVWVGTSRRISSTASSPSMCGISRSMTSTSGRCRRVASSAAAPSCASSTISIVPSRGSSAAMAVRSSAHRQQARPGSGRRPSSRLPVGSSGQNRRIVAALRVQFGRDGEAAGRTLDMQLAARDFDALAQAGEPAQLGFGSVRHPVVRDLDAPRRRGDRDLGRQAWRSRFVVASRSTCERSG